MEPSESPGSVRRQPEPLIASTPTALSNTTLYQKLPQTKDTYLAFVVAVRDPLNLHLDIYWPEEIAQRYSSSIHYDYAFVSEELEPKVYTRSAYSCHLRGVEIVQSSLNDFGNMKDAYILISKRILQSGGWVLVSVSDIDIYRRVLVNIFDVVGRKSLNHELLNYVSDRTGDRIAKEYIRPIKAKSMFTPHPNVPKNYHIIYQSIGETENSAKNKPPS